MCVVGKTMESYHYASATTSVGNILALKVATRYAINIPIDHGQPQTCIKGKKTFHASRVETCDA